MRAIKEVVSVVLGGAALALVLAACGETPMGPTTPSDPSFAFTGGTGATGGFAEAGKIKVCKDDSGQAAGQNFTFTVSQVSSVSGTSASVTNPSNALGGNCVTVATSTTAPPPGMLSGAGETIRVVESGMPSGFSFDSLKVDACPNEVPSCAPHTLGPASTTNLQECFVNTVHGCTIVFYDHKPLPPPPGQGCSHGYFKNHTTPGQATTVNSFFNGLYTGVANTVTMKDALTLKGGNTLQAKKNLLLLQAAAAYLNTLWVGSPPYPLTQAQLKAQVDAALQSGNTTTIGTLQGQLDDYNNLEGPKC